MLKACVVRTANYLLIEGCSNVSPDNSLCSLLNAFDLKGTGVLWEKI